MIYLKGIITKITSNKEIIETVKALDNDEKILNYLELKSIKNTEILNIFEKHCSIVYFGNQSNHIT